MSEFGSLAKNSLRFLVNYSVRSCLSGVVIYCCWISIMAYSWFTWHVILCTLGMIPLMSEALLLFAPDELWSRQLPRTRKYFIHGFLMTLGTVLVTAGCIDTFCFITEGYHLYTAHGITGLIAMILMIVSIVSGVMANYSKYLRPVTLKFYHNCFGLLGYIIGIISLCFSFYTNWFCYFTSYESRIVALVATVLGALWTVSPALGSGFRQIKTLVQ
ncbi:transmembrane reductase CYB561D2-like [Tribolium madens]|uniref:transmembrane reductase CYB561D2-like n=1 Tax=Tribolium madens TaxID=41895 RepID=UPI001CF76249|nr:transmembrane reductase CYB561D2-like [Tribolium madens]